MGYTGSVHTWSLATWSWIHVYTLGGHLLGRDGKESFTALLRQNESEYALTMGYNLHSRWAIALVGGIADYISQGTAGVPQSPVLSPPVWGRKGFRGGEKKLKGISNRKLTKEMWKSSKSYVRYKKSKSKGWVHILPDLCYYFIATQSEFFQLYVVVYLWFNSSGSENRLSDFFTVQYLVNFGKCSTGTWKG